MNLVEWLKMMVGIRRAEEVVDPRIEPKPTARALKRALFRVVLKSVDPESEQRPKMRLCGCLNPMTILFVRGIT